MEEGERAIETRVFTFLSFFVFETVSSLQIPEQPDSHPVMLTNGRAKVKETKKLMERSLVKREEK